MLLGQILGQPLCASCDRQELLPNGFLRALQQFMHAAVHLFQLFPGERRQFSDDVVRVHDNGHVAIVRKLNKSEVLKIGLAVVGRGRRKELLGGRSDCVSPAKFLSA
jgi:hypothetical protein